MNDKKSSLEPCRQKVSRTGVKKALSAFVGACGAATVMTLALNSSLNAQPAGVKGGIGVKCVTTTPATGQSCATNPATKPADPSAKPVPIGGKPVQVRIETN